MNPPIRSILHKSFKVTGASLIFPAYSSGAGAVSYDPVKGERRLNWSQYSIAVRIALVTDVVKKAGQARVLLDELSRTLNALHQERVKEL